MSRLNYRQGLVLLDSNSEPNWGAAYSITAYPIGAKATSASTGTTLTVAKGHGFIASQKLLVGTDTTKYRSVSSVTATTIVVDQAVSVSAGDLILNLGADTGSSTPNYDGSPIKVYTSSDKTTAATNATVTSDSTGNYEYWHYCWRSWELLRDSSGTISKVIPGIGDGTPGEVNACDFGANPADSTVDSSSYIQRALDSIEVFDAHPSGASGEMGGVVILPTDDYGAYGIGATVTLTYGRRLEGRGGMPRLVCTTSGLSKMLDCDSSDGTRQARQTGVANIHCDGNSNAAIGIYIGSSGRNHWDTIICNNCTDVGMVLDYTQNSVFTNIMLGANGTAAGEGGGLRLENAASNNAFYGVKARNNIPFGIRFQELATQSSYANYNYSNNASGPAGNSFHGSIVEEMSDASSEALIYFSAGQGNDFSNTNIVGTSQTVAKPLVSITDDDEAGVIGPANYNRFLHCNFNGTASVTHCFSINDVVGTMVDGCRFKNIDDLFTWDETTPGGTVGAQESEANNYIMFTGSNIIESTVADYFDFDTAQTNGNMSNPGDFDALIKCGLNTGNTEHWGNLATDVVAKYGDDDGSTQTVSLTVKGNGTLTWPDRSGSVEDVTAVRNESASLHSYLDLSPMFACAIETTVGKAGGGQDTTLANAINRFFTIVTPASANDSVTLPPAKAGLFMIVANKAGANSLNIFPSTDDAINDASPNAAVACPADNMAICVCEDTTTWHVIVVARV